MSLNHLRIEEALLVDTRMTVRTAPRRVFLRIGLEEVEMDLAAVRLLLRHLKRAIVDAETQEP